MGRLFLLVCVIGLGTLSFVARDACAADALDARVTIAFSNASAADVITSIATAAGLKADIASGPMRPVTITLTNVRLATALNAVCDNALCTWRLAGSLKVTPLPSEASAALPTRLSFEVDDLSPIDAFRALAVAIGVVLTIEPQLPSDTITLRFKDAPTPEVLNTLCEAMHCSWDFDLQRGLRVTKKR
jgi:hypothetical protein